MYGKLKVCELKKWKKVNSCHEGSNKKHRRNEDKDNTIGTFQLLSQVCITQSVILFLYVYLYFFRFFFVLQHTLVFVAYNVNSVLNFHFLSLVSLYSVVKTFELCESSVLPLIMAVARARNDYDCLIKLLLIGDSGKSLSFTFSLSVFFFCNPSSVFNFCVTLNYSLSLYVG